MKLRSSELIEDLIQRTKKNLKQAAAFKLLSLDELNKRMQPDSWSILECLEHLNIYGDFYLPEIEERMKNSSKDSAPQFKSGWLGGWFAKSMLPKEKLNKMKAFKSMNPINSVLDRTCIDRFIRQQEKMLELLDIAGQKNLNRVRTSISISKLITLRLGDTLRVVIYHNDRHILQALKLTA